MHSEILIKYCVKENDLLLAFLLIHFGNLWDFNTFGFSAYCLAITKAHETFQEKVKILDAVALGQTFLNNKVYGTVDSLYK